MIHTGAVGRTAWGEQGLEHEDYKDTYLPMLGCLFSWRWDQCKYLDTAFKSMKDVSNLKLFS